MRSIRMETAINFIARGDYYEPSNATTTLTVQSTPIPAAITSEPLPTDYWTRRIYGENTNWYAISSNWLGVGSGGYTGLLTAFGGNGIGPDESCFTLMLQGL